jgi:hypothetical protein
VLKRRRPEKLDGGKGIWKKDALRSVRTGTDGAGDATSGVGWEKKIETLKYFLVNLKSLFESV